MSLSGARGGSLTSLSYLSFRWTRVERVTLSWLWASKASGDELAALAAVCLASFLRELLTFILGWAGFLLPAKPEELLGLPACPKPPEILPAGAGHLPALAGWKARGSACLISGRALQAGGRPVDGAGSLSSSMISSSWLLWQSSTMAAAQGAKSAFCA